MERMMKALAASGSFRYLGEAEEARGGDHHL